MASLHERLRLRGSLEASSTAIRDRHCVDLHVHYLHRRFVLAAAVSNARFPPGYGAIAGDARRWTCPRGGL